ncbi:MAG: peptidoglycan-associated lipoprotein Pal [Candidatus Eisenbacteria bacterium]
MKVLVVIALMICVACWVGCGPKKVSPLDEADGEGLGRPGTERAREGDLEPGAGEKPIRPLDAEDEKEIVLSHINFAYDKYNLSDEATTNLSRNGALLMDNPDLHVLIEGHCDERGTEEYNLALGEKRALAARDFMTRFGIAKSRLSIVSYGEERPADPGHHEAAWAKNRRAIFVVK